MAKGTYFYNSAADTCSFLVTRAVVCFVDKNLNIIGGYDGSNWSTTDPQNNLTIIDGGRTYRGVAIIAYAKTANLVLDGFTVQNGLAQGGQSTDTFVNAGFGGGIWAQNSSVTLKNINLKNNRSVGANLSFPSGGSGSGGGLAITSTKTGGSTLENVIFDGNEASGGSGATRGGVAFGGGLYTYSSTLTGTNLTFTNNTARAGDSSGSGFDAGLYADALGGAAGFCNSNTTLNHVTATGNHVLGGDAGTNGGAGGGFGGGIFHETGALTLTDAKIRGNSVLGGVAKKGGVAMGGGIMTDSSETTINRVWVIANQATSGGSSTSFQVGAVGGGGGYFVHWGTSGVYHTSITNSVFSDNMAAIGSPGSNVNGGGGGGAAFQGVQANVTHTTFAKNTLGNGVVVGQAVSVFGNGDGTGAVLGNLTMRYSIISDHIGPANSSALTVLKNNSASLSYVLFANNTRNTNQDSNPLPPGNITLTKPIYKSSVGYVSPGSPNYDYHLNANSSAIDQAIGSTTFFDIDDQSRPKGLAPDVGAVEKGPNLNLRVFVPSVRK